MANTTWDPSNESNVVLSNLNLTAALSSSPGSVFAVDRQITGKFYWEYTANVISAAATAPGVATLASPLGYSPHATGSSYAIGISNASSGSIWQNGSMLGSGLGSIINSTVIGIALDLVNSLVWFKVLPSGNWNGSGAADPATGVGGLSLWGPGIPIYPYAPFGNAGDKITANFGDSAFTGTAPSGFTAGFTAGATPALNEVATQVGVETWGNSNPSLNLTQIGIEVWGTPVGPGTEVTVTQIGAEVWAAVQAAPVGPPRRRPIVTIIQ